MHVHARRRARGLRGSRPPRQASATLCPRAAMPRALSSTWFWPPRHPAAVSTWRTFTGVPRAQLPQLGHLRVRVVGVERRDGEARFAEQEPAAQDVVADEGPRRGHAAVERSRRGAPPRAPAAPTASCSGRSSPGGRRRRRRCGARDRCAGVPPARPRAPTRAPAPPSTARGAGRTAGAADPDTSRCRGSTPEVEGDARDAVPGGAEARRAQRLDLRAQRAGSRARPHRPRAPSRAAPRRPRDCAGP